MSNRYFSDSPLSVGPALLAGPEAHHLIHVMRAVRGLRIVLFDGGGAEFPAVVERVGRDQVELDVLAREEVDRELPFAVTLGVAVPKGDRQRWLVEKAVELGVTRLVPLWTQRGVAQPVQQAIARLRRAVIEASKQCGRNRLMAVGEPHSWLDYLQRAPTTSGRWLAQPKGFHKGVPLFATDGPSEQYWLAVGPEGGLSSAEVSLAVAAGWHTVDLGPRILRVETAALLLASLVTQLVA